ncbi:ABC transporter permease [Enterovibrio norvegicus]|uniref:ABC transporter ATP-binding protein n=1 Tax=Enterovibrio norvegicus TaxID=188144 RepID=UPI0002F9BF55|nr:ABC transporter ATP-binding protein [Enterovibrio norvegicus]OEF63293.1 ABC transporter permease [Enterovibrio norvegicus]
MDEQKQLNSAWPVLWRLLKTQRCKLTAAVGISLFAAALELAPYWLLFEAVMLVQAYLQHEMMDPSSSALIADGFYHLALGMAAVLVAKTLAYGLAYTLSHQSAFLILADTRRLLASRLAWAPLTWFQGYQTGQLKQAVMQDVEKMENFFSHHTVEVSVAVFGPLLVTGYLFWIDWRLALAALIAAPAAILSSFVVMRGLNKHYDQYHAASIVLNNTVVEYIRNIAIMKLFRQDSERFKAMSESLVHYFSVVDKITVITVPRWALFTCLLGASILFILPVGMYLVQTGEIDSINVVMAALLGAGMLKPLLKISHFFTEIQEILSGVRRLMPIIDMTEHRNDHETCLLQSPLVFSLHKLHFSYSDVSVLEDVTLSFKPCTTTIILGMSGSGKSTLVQLMAGLLTPDSGDIFINNVPIKQLNESQRASLLSLASQDAFLFKGTLKENLMFANPHASVQEVNQALQTAGIESLIKELPEGLNTKIAEQGVRLSGGEKQRVALARTLLVNAPIVLLDEATAYADNLTQRAFYQNLKKHYPDKTVVVVAHRTYGLEDADQIVLMENGKVRAKGSHNALIQSDDFYATLWRLQNNNDDWMLSRQLADKEGALSNG